MSTDLKTMTMDEKKISIQFHMGMLKQILIDTGMIIAFNKTDDKFLFMDREIYITKNKMSGFEIDFKELT